MNANENVETVPMSDLVLDHKNARLGDVSAVADSLREFGQHRPLVVQRSSGRIIAGNHTYKAAQSLGWAEIVVWWVDDDDVTAVRRGIADNATSDNATWDEDVLADLLREVGTDVPGIDKKHANDLFARLAADTAAATTVPDYPLVARMNEEYEYVVIMADNEVDAAWLRSKMMLRRERSNTQPNVALGHVITVERLRKALGE
jgi:hypothetical protein